MFKISICGVALFLAGLVACSNQSGLNVTGGSTSGGQGTSGTGGSTGGGQTTGQNDCEKAGGTCEQGAPGACLGGWSPNTGGYSCASSTTSCCLPLSYSPCETAGGTCTQVQPARAQRNNRRHEPVSMQQHGRPHDMLHAIRKRGVSGTGGTSGGAAAAEPRELGWCRWCRVWRNQRRWWNGFLPPGFVLYYYAGLCWRVPAEPRRPVRLSHLRAEA